MAFGLYSRRNIKQFLASYKRNSVNNATLQIIKILIINEFVFLDFLVLLDKQTAIDQSKVQFCKSTEQYILATLQALPFLSFHKKAICQSLLRIAENKWRIGCFFPTSNRRSKQLTSLKVLLPFSQVGNSKYISMRSSTAAFFIRIRFCVRHFLENMGHASKGIGFII